MSAGKLKVMIVEDSIVVQKLLEEILTSDDGIAVTSIVGSAEEALEEIKRDKPDLVTIDYSLPNMDGLDLTKIIMKEFPIPIVVVSAVAESATVKKSFELIQAGALATIKKPVGLEHSEYQRIKNHIISTVKTMSEVKLVRRRDLKELTKLSLRSNNNKSSKNSQSNISVVAIGASTGGPTAIQLILKKLPSNFPVPIVIAQHIADGFVEGFVSWLSSTTGFNVKIAANGEKLNSSTAYVCPSGFQTSLSSRLTFDITNDQFVNGVRPSVSHLFKSIANQYGSKAVGIILSGMGKDGATELKEIKDLGGITIAQDKDSSTIHGMPKEAINIGATDYVLAAEQIPNILIDLVSR